MKQFRFQFSVKAPVKTVNEFHQDSASLKKLTPPPMFMKIEAAEPMGNGSLTQFTLWLGPFPIRWHARHSDVTEAGFTDTQEAGPLAFWKHSHRFKATGPDTTTVYERIEYQHKKGLKGWVTRLLFSIPSLYFLFTYRKLITRIGVKNIVKKEKPLSN